MPDLTLTITIPEAKRAEAVAAFLVRFPNITNDPSQWKGQILTDSQWFTRRIRMWVNEQINDGRRHLHRVNNPEPGDDEFTA